MNSSKLKAIGLVIVGLIVAIYLGISAATAQTEAIGSVGIILILLIGLTLGKNLWLLIPGILLANISLRLVPGSLSFQQLAMIMLVGFVPVMVMTRRLKLRFQWDGLMTCAFLILLTVVQVYLRNPVGLSITGSANVGARPYVNFVLAFLTFGILAGMVVEKEKITTARNLCLTGGILVALVRILSLIPGLSYSMAYIFGTAYDDGGGAGGEGSGYYESEVAGRNYAPIAAAAVLSRWIVSRVSPLSGLFKFQWGFLITASLALAALGGFRSKFFAIAITFAFAVYYYNGKSGVFISALLSLVVVLIIAVVNLLLPLPGSIQRSLSFIPGTWEEIHTRDAEDSTEWRTEMWMEVLTTDRWIKNKLIGDGLGFTKDELSLQIALREGIVTGSNASGFDAHRESLLINGDYHSGPVSLIRTTGYIGLSVFFCALCVLAFKAHRFIMRYRGTTYFGVICMFCIPMVWHPIFFALIFGSFLKDIPLFFIHAGLFTLMRRSLPPPEQLV